MLLCDSVACCRYYATARPSGVNRFTFNKTAQLLRPVKPLGGFSAYSPARFFETGGFLPVSKMGSRRQASNRLFAPDLCDKQALDFMGLKNRRKTYHLCNGRQKNRREFGYVVLSNVLWSESRWKPDKTYGVFLNIKHLGLKYLVGAIF